MKVATQAAKLLHLGRAMGLETYVARNDRSSAYDGTPLSDLATVDALPVGLPEADELVVAQ